MARPREHLPRLNIPQNLNMQQPVGGQGMFSPALPTTLQQAFHPPYPMHSSLQTPMQAFFIPQTPSAPGRPTHQSNASVAQLAAAGIRPPNGFTPVTSHFPRPSVMLGPPPPFIGQQPSGHPFPNRNRRQPSIGGPPKAVLGGPARKLSPLPTVAVIPMASSATPQKVKKVIVNFPRETVPGEDGQPPTRPSWARSPLVNHSVYHDQDVPPVDLQTRALFPPDSWRFEMPDTIDVFLPGKLAWDTLKQQAIEAKLEKLGVERGSGSNIPFIHAPHARAASISSPADPALLFFKLNKLQQSLDVSSAGNSLSTSPQPPFGLSPPPRSRFITNRHGHTMSLAQPPSYRPTPFDGPLVFNPFGPNATLGSDQDALENLEPSALAESIHAPQGRIPVTLASLAPPPLSAVPRSDSRPDFIRGFGLDIPEEEEEAQQDEAQQDGDATQDMELEETGTNEITELDGGRTTAPQSRHHSRHVSRLSAALSLRSVGGNLTAILGEDDAVQDNEVTHLEQQIGRDDVDVEDAIGEWTGSEDVYLGNESSDNESIGEWSNPSDEERVRQERVRRRLHRTTAQQLDQPRRIPNFPRPPENTMMFSSHRDDEIVSNPSEENLILKGQTEFLSQSGLSPLPHSRVTSVQYSLHDPAMAHSRIPSENFEYPNISDHESQPSLVRRDSLNPFAKPFVFGKPLESSGSGCWEGISGAAAAPNAPLLSHTRLPSFGKPLNVAAPEFKPGGFTFRPPAGVPQMPTPGPGFPQDITAPVENTDGSPFKIQGREKRQRRGSSGSIEEGDSMSSFRFPPNLESPQSIRHMASLSGSRHKLNPSAEPFTFAGFSAVATLPYVPKAIVQQDAAPDTAEETLHDDSTTKAEENEDGQTQDFHLPPAAKPKRAPIPLDFKHPVSSNTVPAGLFKALVNNGDERTRRAVRSRLSSRETFDHLSRPSMDDIHVPPIAHQASRGRLVTDPGERPSSAGDEDIFSSTRHTTHTRRRSSLPDALRDDNSSVSEMSVAPQDLTSRMEMHKVEHVLSHLLDEKLTALRRDLSKREQNGGQALAPTTEAMIADVVSLFRAQLQESAGRSLEDSQLDARGEMDFELIKDVVEEGHREILLVLKAQLQELVEQLSNRPAGNSIQDIVPVVEQVGNKTTQAVIEAISEFSARQEAIGHVVPARERDALMDQLISVLNPMLTSMQTDPIDYEFLTSRLTQAVKPHISQLIDLASDKRETAGLIVDRILPLLPNSTVDTDAITLQLITEVRRAIAPIDAFEIKEQVADLVVERLDSRLAVRDKAFNVDTVTGRVTDGVAGLLEPLQRVPATLDQLVVSQDTLSVQQQELNTLHGTIATALSELPSQVDSCLTTLQTSQQSIFAKLEAGIASASQPNDGLTQLKSTVEGLAANYQALNHGNEEFMAMHKQVLDKVTALPDTLFTNINAVHKSLAEMITSRDNSKREVDELRKLNNDYQVQLTKSRAAHGQVRVEKDVLNEKLGVVEVERDQLKVQVAELQSSAKARAAETVTLESRNSELEEALSKALARLQSSDVATQANQQRIADLEKSNRELTAEKQASKTKVDSLELQVTFASRDKESTAQALEALQKQHEALASQQAHWDDLRHASEKIDMLTNLIGQADNDELKELRRHRERSKALEGEHATLQKRFRELEAKVSNSERAATTVRQSLAQAQQRSAEWERRAKEYEGQLEMTQTKLDQAEQTQAQLDADYSLMKLQFEEREADDRLAKDRENKMRDQMAALENKVRSLQTELLEAKTSKVTVANRNIMNGNSHPPPRPDSRASTIYDGRSVTPNRRISTYSTTSGRTNTPPQASVWQSMHAPTDTKIVSKHTTPSASIHAPKGRYPPLGPSTPKARRPAYPLYNQAAPPSPTPSTVSAAPTQGEDGWWS